MKSSILKISALTFISALPSICNGQWHSSWYPLPNWGGTFASSSPYFSDATPWALGGNDISGPAYDLNGQSNFSCGTFGSVPFALKTDGKECLYIDVNQNIAIGDGNTPAPSCVLDIRGNLVNDRSSLRFYGNAAGDITSSTDLRLHYSQGPTQVFEINQGMPGSSIPRLSIDGFGNTVVHHKMRVGANTPIGSGARVAVDGQSSPGVLVYGNNGHMALHVANSAGASRFRFWVDPGGNDDSKAHIAANTQIGFYMAPGPLVDNTVRLNVDAGSHLNGIKITANSNSNRMLYCEHNSASTYEVYSDGRTYIGSPSLFNQIAPRMGLDARTAAGLYILSGNNNYAINVLNTFGAPRFRVWTTNLTQDDTKFHLAGSTQIGFFLNGSQVLEDANARLNVEANNPLTKGLKITTNNNNLKAIEVFNSNFPNDCPFEVRADGKTHIGWDRPLTTGPAANALLSVSGMVLATEIRVAAAGPGSTHWADFVFEKDYELQPLLEVEKFIKANGHLPGIPSEAEVSKEGIDLVTINANLLQKLEELYLHTIQLQKEVAELKQKVDNQTVGEQSSQGK